MNTKLIMASTAITLGAFGIVLIFIPEEILAFYNMEVTRTLVLVLQILGALYFSYGMMNWMARTSIIGGIYNRPLVVANFSHFFIASLALTKGLFSDFGFPVVMWVATILYILFAVAFGILLFKHPLRDPKPK